MSQPTRSNVASRRAHGAGSRRRRAHSAAVYRRRRLAVGLLALLLVAAFTAVLAFLWPGFARSDDVAAPAPTVTVTPEPPTPSITPIARTDGTAFADALPDSVLRFALTAEKATDDWVPAGALETYSLTYSDAEGANATTVVVTAGQWGTVAEATAAAADLTGSGTPTASGEVTVKGKTVGRFAVLPGKDGTGTVVWRNGTAVLRAVGPADEIQTFYTAYPM